MNLHNLVVIGLGSNLGNSAEILSDAVGALEALASGAIISSSVWKTTPVDCPAGSPDFMNAVVCFTARPGLTPEDALSKLKEIEKQFGRRAKVVLNEARPLDLDLICFGGETRSTEALTLPHPRARLRKFVLAPLAEILPDLVLPGQAASVCEILGKLQTDEQVVKNPEKL